MDEAKGGKILEDSSSTGVSTRRGFGRLLRWVPPAVLVGVCLLPASFALAEGTSGTGGAADGVERAVTQIVTSLFSILTSLVGQLLVFLIGTLIKLAQYNGFVTASAVGNGWLITRDIANMFFIIALLVLAFGTILGLGYTKQLPRLLIMAVLVNFSRTICGLLIDISQVIMLTFVNGFKEAAAGNFINGMQIGALLSQGTTTSTGQDLHWATCMAYLLAFGLTSLAACTVVIFIGVLVVRIVKLWLLIVLSPLAFLTSAVPLSPAANFYKEWWKNFNEQVVVGPFLAFFLWLALISVANDNQAANDVFTKTTTQATEQIADLGPISDAFNAETIEKFVIAIGLLLGGLTMASKMSGVVAKGVATGKGLGKRLQSSVVRTAKKAGWGTVKLGARGAWGGAKLGARGVGKGFSALGGTMAIEKGKERFYGAFGMTKTQLKQRQKIQERISKEKTAPMAQAENDELWKLSSGWNKSPKAIASRNAAMKEMLKRANDPTSGFQFDDEKQYHDFKKRAEAMDETTRSSDLKGAMETFERKNTRFMVDSNATGQEAEDQRRRFKDAWRRKTAGNFGETPISDITPQGVMQADAKQLAAAYDNSFTSAAHQQAMLDSLGIDKESFEGKTKEERVEEIKKKQKELRGENFDYLTSDEKARVLNETGDANALVKNFGVKGLSSLDVETVQADDGKLAKAMAEALEASDIKKLPVAIADVVREALKSDASKYVASGGKLEAIIPSFNAKTGNVGSEEDRRRLNEMIKKDPTIIGQLSSKSLIANNGINDLAIAAAANMGVDLARADFPLSKSKDPMRELIKANPAQAAIMMQALKGISRASVASRTQNVTDLNEREELKKELENAQDQAQQTLNSAKEAVYHAQFREMTFANAAKRGLGSGLKAGWSTAGAGLKAGFEGVKSVPKYARAGYETVKSVPGQMKRGARTAWGSGWATKKRFF